MTLCGGTGEEKVANDEVQALLESVKAEIVTKLGSEPAQFQATHFKTQVVAGLNYFVRVRIGDAKHIHVRIYKHFSGSVEVHDVGADIGLEYYQNMN